MLKKLFLFTLIFYLGFVNNTLAHTGLESSFPQDGEIIEEELEQVTFTFETKIEQGSTFELQNPKGETLPTEHISISENQMIGNFANPLENGEYQVHWKIIGADGHPIDGEFSFSVNVPVTEEHTEEQVEEQEETQPQLNVEEQELDTESEVEIEEIQQNKLPSYVIPTIIGVLMVSVVLSFFMIMRRKK